ncbi:MAG: hypothetical protein OWR52_04595 [Acidibacillus sp.]|nr:hypothetical protein [Acidibacillus sp.]
MMIGFMLYHRFAVANFARTNLAKEFHIPQNQVVIEQVQELGFWRNKLNPFAHHSWMVNFTIPGGLIPTNGLSYLCNIDEPTLWNFKFLGTPITSPRYP